MLTRFTSGLLRHAGLVVLIAVISAIPMGFWSVQLFGDLRADLKELLPENARSVQTLNALERRFGGYSELSILVSSPDAAANRRFSDDLVAALRKLPSFRSVRNKLGEEKAFFEARRHLFVPVDDLETIHERLEDTIAEAKARANPLFVSLEEDKPVELDLSDIEARYSQELAAASRFPDDYFESKDKTQLAIIARKQGLAFGISDNKGVVDAVNAEIARLDPAKYHPALRAQLGGDVKNMVEEHESLLEDIVLATAITTLLLALTIFAYFRTLRSFFYTAVPLTVGLVWTFGLGHFMVGYVNASSAFLGPICAGNGVNFGLILLARYLEERRAGVEVERAIADAVGFTLRGTSGAALAAGISYLSLILTDNRGFQHFGLIAGVGMVVCWAATMIVMPALLALIERRFPHQPTPLGEAFLGHGTFSSIPFRLVDLAPRAVAWAGVALGLAASVVCLRFVADPWERDFNKLRSTYARDEGASAVARTVDAIFDRYSSPQVIVADDLAQVPEVVDHLNARIKAGGADFPLTSVLSMSTLVPPDQAARIVVLEKIRKLLSDELLEKLPPEQKAKALAYRPPAGLTPYGPSELPESIRADFREKDGTEGRVVLVYPNYKLNLYDIGEIHRVAQEMRSIPLSDGRVVESSGNFVIYDDMVASVNADGPKATLVSLVGVLLLCAALFRRFAWVPVYASLLLGMTWLGAGMFGMELKINFLNFIAVPITVGIGVDYAVNIYTRYLIERVHHDAREATRRAVVATGGAVMLCSATTVIGYGSLLVARNGSLISFGQAAILGEATCLLAAILVMPAWLYGFRGRGAAARAHPPEGPRIEPTIVGSDPR